MRTCLKWIERTIIPIIPNILLGMVVFYLTLFSYKLGAYMERQKIDEDKKPEVIKVYIDREIIKEVEVPVEVYVEPEEGEGQVITDEEREYLARCVQAEAGNQGYLGKVYVVDCILNRGGSIIDTINAPDQFNCVHNGQINIKPDEETYQAVDDELSNRTNWEIKYFRTKHYHTFGTPCFQYKDHYFSK